VESFEATGKVWFTEDEKTRSEIPRWWCFPEGRLNKDVRRQVVQGHRGNGRGLKISETVRIILLPAKGAGTDDVLAKEKLCPVVAILPCKSF